MDDFKAEATPSCDKDGKQCKGHPITGTWSTIYDQAFEVTLTDGTRFLANFKYSLKTYKNSTMAQFQQLKTGDYDKFNSECDKTMVGFVQTIPSVSNELYGMTNHKISCFYGNQETHYEMEKTVSVNTESESVKLAVIT